MGVGGGEGSGARRWHLLVVPASQQGDLEVSAGVAHLRVPYLFSAPCRPTRLVIGALTALK